MKKAWVAVIILNIRVKKRKMEIGMIMAEGQALIRPERYPAAKFDAKTILWDCGSQKNGIF
jgi:hypothetical protein